MIVVMQPGAGEGEIAAVAARIRERGLDVHLSRGAERTLIGVVGSDPGLDPRSFDAFPGVDRALLVGKPYKIVARETQRGPTVIDVGGRRIGGREVQVIAGRSALAVVDTSLAG